MKFYYYIIGIVFLFFVNSIHMNAQNKDYYGFSKTYVYTGDSLRRIDAVFANMLYYKNSKLILFPIKSITYSMKGGIQWNKININGDIVKNYIDTISNTEFILSSLTFGWQNDTNYFYSCGNIRNWDDKTFSVLFQKMDRNLNLVWRKRIKMVDGNRGTMKAIIPIDSIHLMISVTTDNSQLNSKVELWKIDTAGNIIWKKFVDSAEWNNIKSMTLTNDGKVLLCGNTSGYGVATQQAGFMIKIDTAGNKIWHKVYNLPDYNGLEKIIATSDGHYICAGWARTPSTVIYMSHKMPNAAGRLLKIDENGNIIWDKIIDISDRGDEFRTLIQTNNGDIIALGSSYKYYAYDSYNYQVGSTREPDGWAVRLDKDGNIKWSRVFGHNAEPHAHDYLYNAIALPDGGFVASGNTMIRDSTWWEDGKPISAIRSAGWVVKLDSMGCLGPGCPEMLADYIDSMKNPKPPIEHITEITLYPNPGGNQAILENKAGFSEEAYYYISDMQGKIIQDKTYIGKQTQVSIHFKGSANAQYIIKLQHNFRMYSFKYAKVKD